jgi:putative SOS response-associated peptidase YedK
VSWKLSRTVLRGAVGGNVDCLLDQKREKGVKQPYAIGMKDGSSFAFAGLWETWIETQQVIERRLDLAAERVRRLEERRRLEEMEGTLFPLTPEEREGKADPDADPTPRTLLTFTIITCDPNELTPIVKWNRA